MAIKYNSYTWFILLGMITSGAFRSIIVKLAYQSGLEAPLTVTLLYLLGQSLSLLVYFIEKRVNTTTYNKELYTKKEKELRDKELQFIGHSNGDDDEFMQDKYVEMGSPDSDNNNSNNSNNNDIGGGAEAVVIDDDNIVSKQLGHSKTISFADDNATLHSTYSHSKTIISFAEEEDIKNTTCCHSPYELKQSFSFGEPSLVGSTHGLTIQSEEQIRWWIHYIPWYLKPAIPAIFNLLNSALRWASLLYIDASVAEMLISGLELALSVVAARIFRGRVVAKSRWVGVAVVTIGVIIIERANNSKHPEEYDESNAEGSDDDNNSRTIHTKSQVTIGVILIVVQSIFSALQDIGEEIFIQAADFSALMMLGMEGLYGFCIGLLIYVTIGDHLKVEDIDSTMSMLSENAKLRWWLVGLPILFLITGIFNIRATEVTSAMTRNVWKNLRTVLVWAIALCLYYGGHNQNFGESWHTPGSYYILLGFIVMTSGIIVYYWYK